MLKTSLFDEGPPEPVPERLNMARYVVGDTARRLPQGEAMVVAPEPGSGPPARWSFANIDRAVRRVARALHDAGVGRGARVAITVGDRPEFPALHFGAIAAGAVAVPLSSQLTAEEIARAVADCDACIVCGGAPVPGRAHLSDAAIDVILSSGAIGDYADTHAEEPAFLVYTSGSTGRAKGVLHAHRSVVARRMMHRGWHGLSEGDRILHAGAFNWTYTLGVGLSDPWSVGATAIVFSGKRVASVWPRLARLHGATVFAAAPGVYRQMLKCGADLAEGFATLDRALTAGESLPESIHEDWSKRTGVSLYESLGMSECSTYVSSCAKAPPRPGRSGRPQPGRRVAILPRAGGASPLDIGEEGILAVHHEDPGLMLRYWNRNEETAASYCGNWFLTGDLATMDDDGYIAYRGRADDLMNAGGYRVSPLEVEAVLNAHAGVVECACTEVRIDDSLSIIGAFIVGTASRESLEAHCAAALARYKCPREYVFVEALHRTPNGKINRRMHARTAAQ